MMKWTSMVAACVCAWTGLAWADEKVESLYQISTEGSSVEVRMGTPGKVVLEIRAQEGAHVSDEAPLKIELQGRAVKLAKEKLTLADSPGRKPRFEVPVEGVQVGSGAVEAKMTFFICTEKL